MRIGVLACLTLSLSLMTSGFAVAQTLPVAIPADTAHRDIKVVVTRGLTQTKSLTSPALRAARKAMLADKAISDANLRALADHADGLAALKYFHILQTQAPAAAASDIAYYGTVAVSTGRVWPLQATVDAMYTLDPATEPPKRIKAYLAMLYPYAWAGNSVAMDTLIDMNGEGRLFGPMSDATRAKVVAQATKAGDGRALLRMALALMQNPDPSDKDRALIQDYLERASKGNNLAVKATATNLLAMNVIDKDPSAAVTPVVASAADTPVAASGTDAAVASATPTPSQ